MQHDLVTKGWVHPFWYPEQRQSPQPTPRREVPPFREGTQGDKARGVLSLATAPGFTGSLWAERSPYTSQMENPVPEK